MAKRKSAAKSTALDAESSVAPIDNEARVASELDTETTAPTSKPTESIPTDEPIVAAEAEPAAIEEPAVVVPTAEDTQTVEPAAETVDADPLPLNEATTPEPAVSAVATAPPARHRRHRLALFLICLLIIIGAAIWLLRSQATAPSPQTVKQSAAAAQLPGLKLDTQKDYGNKYADGMLPVGDGKYKTDAAAKGYIYACSQYAQNLTTDQGGAGTRGPWFSGDNTHYDSTMKAHVQGTLIWQASFTNTVSGSTRTIATNDLPSHPTGVFPIMSSDPAYAYDRNPNKITDQKLTYSLNSAPAYGQPNCMGGEAGIMLTGVALFNAFDAGGRDAGTWEVQDSCNGHPQVDGEYHYHTLSSCIKDASVSTVIGYALDGFPITGPKVGPNNILTTSDLDECHGLTSQINRNGKLTYSYHYVMTQDFPYSVSCFRATAIQPPHSATATAQGPTLSTPPARP